MGMTYSGNIAPSATCSQYTTLAAALDGSQNVSATQTAICGLVSDGVFSSLDALWVFATNSTANAKVNWINPGTHNVTITGTVTFNANQGYTGDASTGFLNTGINPTSLGGHYTQNSGSAGVCQYLAYGGNTGGAYIAANDGTNYLAINSFGSGTGFFYDINESNFPNYNSPTQPGQWTASRTASTTLTLYQNGSSVATSAGATSGLLNQTVYILAQNNNGTANTFAGGQLGFAFIGGGLNSTQVGNINSRMHTYLGAISAPTGC